jgi:hypothetical protein
MFTDASLIGSVVIDINTNRLDARFLLSTGAIADSFTIIKGAPGPLDYHVSSFIIERTNVVSRWKSVPGLTYQLERTSNLQTATWQPVGDPIVATGATICWTNGVRLDSPAGFFRVLQLTPQSW